MRLPATAHSAQPWRIHELAFDFRVEDVWELPTDPDRVAFRAVVGAFTGQQTEQQRRERMKSKRRFHAAIVQRSRRFAHCYVTSK